MALADFLQASASVPAGMAAGAAANPPGFFDRILSNLQHVSPEAWQSLASGLAQKGTFAQSLAGGLTGMHHTIDEQKKQKSLADALSGAMSGLNLSPQAQGVFGAVAQNDPSSALGLIAPQLFDPMAQFKANYWRNQQGGGQEPQQAAPEQAPPAPPQPSMAQMPAATSGFTGSGLSQPGAETPGLNIAPRIVPQNYRNNNPGNIRPVGASTGFQSYATPEAGVQAIQDNLMAYNTKHGINTLQGIISRWAPPNENPTAQLIQNASMRTGFKPDQPLNMQDPQTMQTLTRAIIAQEQGKAQQGSPAPAPAAPQAPAPQRPSAAATPQGATQESELRLAQEAGMAGDDAGKSYHLNRANQLANQDIAASVLDPTYVQKMAKYEVPLPSQARNPALYAEAVRQISQMNPKFNANYYEEIHRARDDFQTGKDGQTLQAVNNATQHLDLLAQASKAYERHDWPMWNQLQSAWLTQTGSPLPGNLEGIAATAALESAKALLPGGGGEAERQAFERRFSSALAEGQLTGKIDGQIGLMQGQINSLRLKYNKATKGTLDDFNDYILPEAQQAFDRIRQQGGGAGGPPPSSPGGVIHYDAQGNRVQ